MGSCRKSNKLAQNEMCASYCGTEELPSIMAYNAVPTGTGYVRKSYQQTWHRITGKLNLQGSSTYGFPHFYS